jgi:hypothetical protein
VHLWRVSDFIKLGGQERKVMLGSLVTQFTSLLATQTVYRAACKDKLLVAYQKRLSNGTWPHPGITMAFISHEVTAETMKNLILSYNAKQKVYSFSDTTIRSVRLCGSQPPLPVRNHPTALN